MSEWIAVVASLAEQALQQQQAAAAAMAARAMTQAAGDDLSSAYTAAMQQVGVTMALPPKLE